MTTESKRLDDKFVAFPIPAATFERIQKISQLEARPIVEVLQRAVQQISDQGYSDEVINPVQL